MNERPNREETIFHAALQLAPDKRAAYLELACEGDPSVRDRIGRLLQAQVEADPFFCKEPLRVALGDSSTVRRSPCRAPTACINRAFEQPVGTEWSLQARTATPQGTRMFLGKFGNTTVRVTLNNLPPHSRITVTFDLLCAGLCVPS